MALALLVGNCAAHVCNHNKIALEPKILGSASPGPDDFFKNRLLQTFRPMKVAVDYQMMDAKFSTSSDLSALVKSVFMPQIVSFVQTYLQVTGSTTVPRIPSDTCGSDVQLPSNWTSGSTTNDLVIFVTAENSQGQTFVAQATACSLDSVTNRPNVGYIDFNFAYLSTDFGRLDRGFRVALHETMHILGFSSALYQYYTGYSATNLPYIVQNNVYYITTPNLVNYAKDHYGCSSITGVKLEDGGGSGSAGAHFEKTWVGNELMGASDNAKLVISGFILNLLKDTGWYLVDMSAQEYLSFGYKEGCSFVSNAFLNSVCTSPAFPEFCPQSANGSLRCQRDFNSISQCGTDTFSNNCLALEPDSTGLCNANINNDFVFSSSLESKGASSRCIPLVNRSTLLKAAGCFKISCGSGSFTVTIGSSTFTCRQSGDQVTATTNFDIVCPDPTTFCNEYSLSNCQGSDCSGNGTCKVNGKCACRFGFTTDTCATKLTTCPISSNNLCQAYFGTNSNNPTPTWTGIMTCLLVIFASLL